MSEWKWKNSKV